MKYDYCILCLLTTLTCCWVAGPCQTPTLTFCVERHQAIQQFQPESYWVVKPRVQKAGKSINAEWSRGRVFDVEVAACLQRLVAEAGPLHVVNVSEKEERRNRPHGLNTVELLKLASTELGMGPAHAMSVAERLYIQVGILISFPLCEIEASISLSCTDLP